MCVSLFRYMKRGGTNWKILRKKLKLFCVFLVSCNDGIHADLYVVDSPLTAESKMVRSDNFAFKVGPVAATPEHRDSRHVSPHTDLQNIKRVNLSVTAERLNGAHSSIQTEADFIIDKSVSSIQSLLLSVGPFPFLSSSSSLCFSSPILTLSPLLFRAFSLLFLLRLSFSISVIPCIGLIIFVT